MNARFLPDTPELSLARAHYRAAEERLEWFLQRDHRRWITDAEWQDVCHDVEVLSERFGDLLDQARRNEHLYNI